MIHLVAIERVPKRPIPLFLKALEEYSDDRHQMMPSIWLVDTPLVAEELHDKLFRHISRADSLLVIRVRSDYGGYLTQDAQNWLAEAVNSGRLRLM